MDFQGDQLCLFYIIRGSNSACCIFGRSMLNGKQTPLNSEYILEEFLFPGKQKKVTKVIPLCKNSRNIFGASNFTLKAGSGAASWEVLS